MGNLEAVASVDQKRNVSFVRTSVETLLSEILKKSAFSMDHIIKYVLFELENNVGS